MCRDPEAFSRVTEATVYERAEQCKRYARDSRVCLAYDALYTRPWRYRIPVTACLYTQPRCAGCKHGLRFCDSFAAPVGRRPSRTSHAVSPTACGASRMCAASIWVTRNFGRRRTFRASRCTSWTFRLAVPLASSTPSGGRGVTLIRWRMLRSARDRMDRSSVSGRTFQIPQLRHARTAYCYLPADATDDEIRRATNAFSGWANTHGHTAEE